MAFHSMASKMGVKLTTETILAETNMFAPENRPPQKENDLPIIHFQVLC